MAVTATPRDNNAYRFPVSVKGVVIRDGKVILVRNERDEWELPGGKLELAESPKECLAREIAEELQLVVEPESIRGFVGLHHRVRRSRSRHHVRLPRSLPGRSRAE